MHNSGWPAVLPSSLEKINTGSGCWAPLFSSEPPLYLCLQHFSQQCWARFTRYSQELGGTPWLLWDYPPLQNKQFLKDTLSGVFPNRCLGVRRGQDRRDLTWCINPLGASCSPQNNAIHCPKHPQEQELLLESLKEAPCPTPQPTAAPYMSAGSTKSDAEGSSWSLMSQQKHQLPYPSFPSSQGIS